MMKEPEITLFGRKIFLPEKARVVAGDVFSGDTSNDSSSGNDEGVDCGRCLVASRVKPGEGEGGKDDGEEKQEQVDEDPSQEEDHNPRTSSIDDDIVSPNRPKTENDQNNGATNAQGQKTLKKPDKILPCPRCNSMETKFCYYNNYNVNQPRHFCKSCQRYWTNGGTMRNVPVGAGRRKNKNSASHCHHVTTTEALDTARVDDDAQNGFQNLQFKPNGTILSFDEKRAPNCVRNGEKLDDCDGGGENGSRHPVMRNANGFPFPGQCIPRVPWPIPWNSTLPFPAICPPGFPMPYFPAPIWNVPWLSVASQTVNEKATSVSGPNSPLGKHSRNGELLKLHKLDCSETVELKISESAIVVPKTLRIDDPVEAAKSSIWATLGIKYDSLSRGGLFKALQAKGDEKKQKVTASPLLQANPAALSRSICFHERA